MIEKDSKIHSFRGILGNIINPSIINEVRISPMLKNVIEIGTFSKIPIIPETRDSIITVKDVRVLILRIGTPEALPQQVQLSQTLSQQP